MNSQLGSILAIVILPNFTRSPTAHQMNIQKCEIQDGKLNDIRDYSSNWIFIYWRFFLFFSLVPVYILAVFAVILVVNFIQFFHCEYRRQRKDEIEHNAVVIHTDSEET